MKHLLNLIRKLPPETSHKVGLNGLKGLNKIGLLEKMFDFDSTQEQHKVTPVSYTHLTLPTKQPV